MVDPELSVAEQLTQALQEPQAANEDVAKLLEEAWSTPRRKFQKLTKVLPQGTLKDLQKFCQAYKRGLSTKTELYEHFSLRFGFRLFDFRRVADDLSEAITFDPELNPAITEALLGFALGAHDTPANRKRLIERLKDLKGCAELSVAITRMLIKEIQMLPSLPEKETT